MIDPRLKILAERLDRAASAWADEAEKLLNPAELQAMSERGEWERVAQRHARGEALRACAMVVAGTILDVSSMPQGG